MRANVNCVLRLLPHAQRSDLRLCVLLPCRHSVRRRQCAREFDGLCEDLGWFMRAQASSELFEW